ncbi:hypothetical protein BpHYR1_052537 [Brachionus plicatilis]|uniref:Uncharacterized protein n=1 Tax=Brachionus plicatilis TaxID=10195 RepID=A0A3M7T3L1_BRAPC|nr:hypothetical protein BpHYR1_052537 [Brachionus plicatilis]
MKIKYPIFSLVALFLQNSISRSDSGMFNRKLPKFFKKVVAQFFNKSRRDYEELFMLFTQRISARTNDFGKNIFLLLKIRITKCVIHVLRIQLRKIHSN